MWAAVAGLLGDLADSGSAVVVVTHDRDLVRALDADEVVLRTDGAVPVAREHSPSRIVGQEARP